MVNKFVISKDRFLVTYELILGSALIILGSQ